MDERIKAKSVLTFLMSIVTVLILVFFYLFHLYHHFVVDTLSLEVKERLEKTYPQFLGRIEDYYRTMGYYVISDSKVIEAIKRGDREQLHHLTLPLFNLLKEKDPELENMHFHTPENRSFLRLHRPETFGDDLSQERPLIALINQSGAARSAIEVGRYGFGYRVGIPIMEGMTHLGVLEFGVRLEAFSRMLLDEFGVRSAILVDKKKIQFFYESNPERDPHAKTLGEYTFYKGFGDLIESEEDWGRVQKNYLYKKVGENHYIIFKGAELQDSKGENIGILLINKNINYYMNQASRLWGVALAIGGVLWLLILGILRFGYHRYEERMRLYEAWLLEKNQTLEHLSFFDHLTQIANRRALEERIRKSISRFELERQSFSMVIFDIDDFKRVNDTYGHGAGDEVLKQIARLAKESIRGEDMAGRWGGEEFVLYLHHASISSAHEIAERLRQKIARHAFDSRFNVTCSFGVSEFGEGMDFDSLISRADEALYEAKRQGKNQTILAS
ncbi:cache domain-containing protein [Wolinella succinogenes]|uniref:cache domain-containing protein n=1 Tax=Wolinella succinogenes TaxID=844 RepID=UPI002409006A|nr:cache domain-containing protein [Wolinella succinogenes]